jgi:hypothetical protein
VINLRSKQMYKRKQPTQKINGQKRKKKQNQSRLISRRLSRKKKRRVKKLNRHSATEIV